MRRHKVRTRTRRRQRFCLPDTSAQLRACGGKRRFGALWTLYQGCTRPSLPRSVGCAQLPLTLENVEV
eukprot:6161318-Amphidinium_carterae.1